VGQRPLRLREQRFPPRDVLVFDNREPAEEIASLLVLLDAG
jgi:hypothetical protein